MLTFAFLLIPLALIVGVRSLAISRPVASLGWMSERWLAEHRAAHP